MPFADLQYGRWRRGPCPAPQPPACRGVRPGVPAKTASAWLVSVRLPALSARRHRAMAYPAAVAGAEDFRAAARERRRDAAVLHGNGRDLAAVYMLGYAIECGLKALLARRGSSYPTSGRKGHDLRHLWEAAGFKRRDLPGYRRLFLDEWDTALRYRDALPGHVDAAALYEGGVSLVGYVINRSKGSRRKGKGP